jgi:hypothetical protein
VPPNDNAPPPPWPYYAPPDQVVPPYARAALEAPGPPPGPVPAEAPPAPDAPLPAEAAQPQAGGVSYGTYDRDDQFIDPSGNTGVFTGGAEVATVVIVVEAPTGELRAPSPVAPPPRRQPNTFAAVRVVDQLRHADLT